jgi:SEL1 protein
LHNGERDGIADEYYLDELDGAALETVTMLVLAAALAFLVYYRQMRQQGNAQALAERDRRAREDRDGREVWGEAAGDPNELANQDDPNNGMAGMPGLGADEWVDVGVGGVGH